MLLRVSRGDGHTVYILPPLNILIGWRHIDLEQVVIYSGSNKLTAICIMAGTIWLAAVCTGVAVAAIMSGNMLMGGTSLLDRRVRASKTSNASYIRN